MSPDAPMTVELPTWCRRWMSLKRAREPYDAAGKYMVRLGKRMEEGEWRTEVVCGHHNSILVLNSEDRCTGHDRLSSST